MRWAARWWAPDQVVPLITLKCRIASVAFLAAAEADEPVPPPEPARSVTSNSDGMTIRNAATLVRQRSARSMSASLLSLLKSVCRWVSCWMFLEASADARPFYSPRGFPSPHVTLVVRDSADTKGRTHAPGPRLARMGFRSTG